MGMAIDKPTGWRVYRVRIDGRAVLLEDCKGAGIDTAGVDFHCLRTTRATLLYQAGVDVRDAQELMGHSDITTTQKHYTRLGMTDLQRAAAKVPGVLGESDSKEQRA